MQSFDHQRRAAAAIKLSLQEPSNNMKPINNVDDFNSNRSWTNTVHSATGVDIAQHHQMFMTVRSRSSSPTCRLDGEGWKRSKHSFLSTIIPKHKSHQAIVDEVCVADPADPNAMVVDESLPRISREEYEALPSTIQRKVSSDFPFF